MNLSLTAVALSFGAVLLAGFNPAFFNPASAADAIRVRGVVETSDGSNMAVKTREGDTAAINLGSAKIMAVVKASIDDIKPGDYVGIASLPRSKGGDGALAVLIFPAAMRGTNEGSFPWDLKPNSSMTNATVANADKDVEGRTVTVKFGNKEKKISVADGTAIVTMAPATVTDLKPGATVFIIAQRSPDGATTAGFVVVGANGIVPPM